MVKFNKIFQQTFWQILGKIVTSLSTFIILGLVARKYGEEGTGVLTLSLTYLGIFYLLSDFGFNAHVLKQVTAAPLRGGLQVTDEWQKLLGTRILWSVILVGISLGLLPFLPFATSNFFQAVLIGSCAILASGIFVTSNLIFQSKLRYDLSVLASSLGGLFGLGVFIYLISRGFPIPYLLLGHLLGWTIIAGISLILVKRLTLQVFPIFNLPYIKSLFKDSWPIAATLALNMVYFRADSFMISVFRNNSEVGIYNVAYLVFQTALVLPAFIMNAYYPLLLKSFKEVKKIALALFGLSVLGTLLTFNLAPLIIRILTGGGFSGSLESLQILALGFPAFFLSSLLMWILVTKGKYKAMLLIYALGLSFNIFLNWLFIPQYSFYASSWITVASEYMILVLQTVVLFLE